MKTLAQAEELILQSGYKNKTALVQALKPGLRMLTTRAGSKVLGKSKMGGCPDLPLEIAWPSCENQCLDFILQLNLTEISALEGGKSLPSSGMLYFFGSDKMNGSAKDDALFSSVLYYDGPTERLRTSELPKTCSTSHSCDLNFETTWTINSELPIPPSEDFDSFWDLVEQFSDVRPNHQILGHPYILQPGYDMRSYCEQFYLQTEPHPTTQSELSNWQLLCQIDSDPDGPGFKWGDSGIVYFWIKESDLMFQNFERHWHFKQSC